jgi:hypothetical protein
VEEERERGEWISMGLCCRWGEKGRAPGRKEIEEKEKGDFPRTYAQFQKIKGTFL